MRPLGLGFVSALLLLAPAAGSQLRDARQETIRVASSLVVVPVSVSDSTGKIVAGLDLDRFSLEEDGVRVAPFVVGNPGATPLELALLLDLSGSVRPRFDFEREAASRFLRAVIRPQDSVALLTVALMPRVLRQPTSSLDTALADLQSLRASGEATAFYDALVLAAGSFGAASATRSRRVVVALSDGEDNASAHYRLPEAGRAFQEADSVFYSINPAGRSVRLNQLSREGQQSLETLANQTGGMAFLADELTELDAIFARVSAEIGAQYLLGYYSPAPVDGSFRRIRVTVPSDPGLRIRARQGYYATKRPG
jgi:Ca-activated chloride channel homolog